MQLARTAMSRTTTSDRFVPGTRIGDYVVERQVAYAESAIVYFATHVVLPRQAHIKVTHPGSRTAAIQLLREACILEALSHPGVPRVHECGVLADRRPWCAIEPLSGVALDQFTAGAPVALSDLVVALRDVSDILRHAHERGIVHRRLTASAILRIQRRRSAFAIEDWTDARTLDAAADGDHTVDTRDDIRALGEIAFRALTGSVPAAGASSTVQCTAAPAELTALIDQMLGSPESRPTSADIYDRSQWLCDTLETAPTLERPRRTQTQGLISEAVSARSGNESGGFAVRISRARSS